MEAPICLTEFNSDKRRKSGIFEFIKRIENKIIILEDTWSEEIKIAETSMNNSTIEKVEKVDQSDPPKMTKNSSTDTLGKLREFLRVFIA